MNDYKNFCEFSVRPKTTSKYLMARAALIFMYTLFCVLYIMLFQLMLGLWPMLILLPFIMFAMIRITWRLVDIEYEYSIEAGILKVAVIYGKAGRRVKQRVNIPDMTLITPYNEQSDRALGASDIIEITDLSAHAESEDTWLCVWADRKQGKKRAVIIETNEEMRRIFRLINPSATVRTR